MSLAEASAALSQNRSCDDHPLDVARAFVDLADAHIPIDALDREIRDVTVAAMQLDRVGAHPLGHFGGEELRHRRFLQRRQSSIAQRGRMQRSEEHTSELQSRENLVCRLLLEKKKQR